jgi:hypothetical protein
VIVYFGKFFENHENSPHSLFHGQVYALILTKIGWLHFGRFFTNSSGHPACHLWHTLWIRDSVKRLVKRSFVDIHIADCQNVDIHIADCLNVDIQIVDIQMYVDITNQPILT